jgi:hypothetical protein
MYVCSLHVCRLGPRDLTKTMGWLCPAQSERCWQWLNSTVHQTLNQFNNARNLHTHLFYAYVFAVCLQCNQCACNATRHTAGTPHCCMHIAVTFN